jgi:hypothetical protein
VSPVSYPTGNLRPDFLRQGRLANNDSETLCESVFPQIDFHTTRRVGLQSGARYWNTRTYQNRAGPDGCEW